MKNQYETVFILTPVLSEAQVKETVDIFRDFIKENGGEIINDENWGLKKLAYPIQKKSTGFYQLFQINAEPSFIDELEIQFRRNERIIRFLTLKMDKYSIQYSEKRRSTKQEVTEKKEVV
ncbi:30S ribosomal protein S6 [Bacteroidota bacterium]